MDKVIGHFLHNKKPAIEEDSKEYEDPLRLITDKIENTAFYRILVEDIKTINSLTVKKPKIVISKAIFYNRLEYGVKFLIRTINHEILAKTDEYIGRGMTPYIHSYLFGILNKFKQNINPNNLSNDVIIYSIFKDLLNKYILNKIYKSKDKTIDMKINLFLISMEWLIKLFYLDKDFTKFSNKDINPIIYSLTEFKNEVFLKDNTSIIHIINDNLLKERNNIKINKVFLKHIIHVFLIMGYDFSLFKSIKDITNITGEYNSFYIENCERHVLVATNEYYLMKYSSLKPETKENHYEYISLISKIIEYENNDYFPIQTKKQIVNYVIELFLSDYDLIIETYITRAINEIYNTLEDLHEPNFIIEKLFKMFEGDNVINTNPNALKKFKQILSDFYINKEKLYLKIFEDNPDMKLNNTNILNYIEPFNYFYSKLCRIIKNCGHNMEFKRIFFSSLISIANNENFKKVVFFYTDALLKFRNGPTKINDIEAETYCFAIFDKTLPHIHDKDIFRQYYRLFLAKRCLQNKVDNIDLEKNVMNKIKELLTMSVVVPLENLIHDYRCAKDLDKEKNFKLFDYPSLKFSCIDLKASVWPSFHTYDMIVPPPLIKKHIDSYIKFFENKNPNKIIRIIYSVGTIEIKLIFNIKDPSKTWVNIVCSVLQAIVILYLFENKKSLTITELADISKISPNILKPVLGSLVFASPETKIVTKSGPPGSKKIELSDCFKINTNYKIKSKKIVLPTPLIEDKENVQNAIDNERKCVVDANIVRYMKQNHKILANDFINAIKIYMSSQANFIPTVPIIKRQLEDLIQKEYIERITEYDSSGKSIHYLQYNPGT
jgi:cullin 1